MDRGVTRYALRCINARCKAGQQAARFSTASRVLGKGSNRPSKLYQPSFLEDHQKVYKKQLASEAERFRLLTDSINKDLSVSAEDLGIWVADFLHLSLDKLLEGSDCSEASYFLKYAKVKDYHLTAIINRWFEFCTILTENIDQTRTTRIEKRYNNW